MSKDIIKDIAVEGAKATPPVAVVAHQISAGWTLGSALTAITIAYVAAQLGYLLWKWANERDERKARRAAAQQEAQP